MGGELSLLAALTMGLFGSTHCVAMCGGISGALVVGLPRGVRGSPGRMLPYVLAYNLGRIATYAVAGAALGFLGARAAAHLPPASVQLAGVAIAAVFLVALGLYLGDWWRALGVLERGGARLWRLVEPLGRRWLPVRSLPQAVGVGLVWGWLPCGLVYTALVFALVSGSAAQGASIMLAFGLGTLPMLVGLGFASRWVSGVTRHPAVRRGVGAALVVAGVVVLAGGYRHHQGHYDLLATTVAQLCGVR